MITANDHVNYIRAKVKELRETIANQQNQAKELGVTIEAIEPVALNKTKRAIVAWFKRATETIKTNGALIAATIAATATKTEKIAQKTWAVLTKSGFASAAKFARINSNHHGKTNRQSKGHGLPIGNTRNPIQAT